MNKAGLKRALTATRALYFAARFRPPAVAILMYHSVMDDPTRHELTLGDIIHPTNIFRDQMEVLARDYRPVSLDDVLLFLQGEKDLPRRSVVVTFDDGYADNLEVAAPILNKFGIPAVVYATVGPIDQGRLPWPALLRHAFLTTNKKSWADSSGTPWPLESPQQKNSAFSHAAEDCARLAGNDQQKLIDLLYRELEASPCDAKLMMTWEQARDFVRQGHLVGSHTITHPNMVYISESELEAELRGSRQKLEQELARPIIHFAYPGAALRPIWNDRSLRASREMGYRTAVTTTSGMVRRGDNPLCMQRFGAPKTLYGLRWNLDRTFLGYKV